MCDSGAETVLMNPGWWQEVFCPAFPVAAAACADGGTVNTKKCGALAVSLP